jgi:hypothetical protein
LNANPANTPHNTNDRNRPESIAANPAPHVATINKINNGSTPLSRDTATNDGNTANTNAATNPATTPNRGTTTRYNNHTAKTAQTPSGTNKLNGTKPNNRALNPCNHNPNGGLSTEINPLGSADTKKKLCHERNIERTAAA